MKLTILKNKLKEGINLIEKVVSKSISLPILNNTLFTTEKNFLSLTSTDLEMSIKWWTLAKIEKEGQITIPTNILSSFVNTLSGDSITLTSKDLDLSIKCGNYQTLIKGMNPEDFPIIPQVSYEEKIELPIKEFCKGLASIVDVASFSSVKPEISGVYFLFQKNLLTMVATDSFRLAEKRMNINTNTDLKKEYSFILPQKSAKKIVSIFSEKEGSVFLHFSVNQVLFETYLSETKHPNIHFTSKLVEGEYPDYQEIIPKKYETKLLLPFEEFVNQVKLAALFSGRVSGVKLKVDPNKGLVYFSSKDAEVGEHQSFLKCKIEGEPCEVSFNHRFLLDGLTNINLPQVKKNEITLELNGPERPAILRLNGEENYLYLVMPIRSS